jgi:calpain-15
MGLYRLKICKNGEWQTVTIDDFIPCEPMGKPKFASSSEDEIWIHLLQKAYAKVHKRYLALHELEISHVLNDLTGCPTIIGSVDDPEVVKIIIDNLKQKNIVVIYDIE